MPQTAILLGASGLVGNEVLQLLLSSPDFRKVKIFVRKSISIVHEKLEQHIINFDSISNYTELIKGDVFFCCIGTTIKKAGSRDAFIKVDYTYPTEFAKIAKTNGIKHFLFISSLGADKNSTNFYLKMKGDTESVLEQLNFETLTILRPSVLLGKRNEFRLGENIGKLIMKAISFLFVAKLKKYKPIEAYTVAKAMVILSKRHTQKTKPAERALVILSDKLHELGTL